MKLFQLISILAKNRSQYHAWLPYNIHWQIKNLKSLEDFLNTNPIIVGDVGARGKSLSELDNIKKYSECYAFDPDKETDKETRGKLYKKYKHFEWFLWEKDEDLKFNLFKDRALSSLYNPDSRYKNEFFGGKFDIEKEIDVKAYSLNTIIAKKYMPVPDILKIDTQGTEFKILQGAGRYLEQICMVEVELEFVHIYENQALFYEVCKYMYELGFEILHLDKVYGSRSNTSFKSKGQLIFADVLFGMREDKLEKLSKEQIIKYVILLINYGNKDLAWKIINQNPEIRKQIPKIDTYFKTLKKNIFARFWRYLGSQYNKLLCLLLFLRKTNNLPNDADRCYPYR